MHAVLFRVKRVHWRAVATYGRIVADLGLTAARFDVLRAIGDSYAGFESQAAIARHLGVSRATISLMVKRMIRRRLVWQERHRRDKRKRVVRLTEIGRRAINSAIRRIDKPAEHGLIQRDLEQFLRSHPAFDDVDELPPPFQVDCCHDLLHALARSLGDTSTILFSSLSDVVVDYKVERRLKRRFKGLENDSRPLLCVRACSPHARLQARLLSLLRARIRGLLADAWSPNRAGRPAA
jgi:DNA-binding MarR family transcriptional regulator